MGYMTVVSILNDAWDLIKENPEQFIKNIEDGMENYGDRIVNMYAIGNHSNPMEVHRTFHNNQKQVLVVYGNHMENMKEFNHWKLNNANYLTYKLSVANIAKKNAEETIEQVQHLLAEIIYDEMKNLGYGIDDIAEFAQRYEAYQQMNVMQRNQVIIHVGAKFNNTDKSTTHHLTD